MMTRVLEDTALYLDPNSTRAHATSNS